MTDRDALSQDVDALAARIDARSRAFRANSEFADQQDKIDWFVERQRQLRAKLNAANDGDEAKLAKDDLAREHGTLYDEFVKFEQELDATTAYPHDRVAGARSGLV